MELCEKFVVHTQLVGPYAERIEVIEYGRKDTLSGDGGGKPRSKKEA